MQIREFWNGMVLVVSTETMGVKKMDYIEELSQWYAAENDEEWRRREEELRARGYAGSTINMPARRRRNKLLARLTIVSAILVVAVICSGVICLISILEEEVTLAGVIVYFLSLALLGGFTLLYLIATDPVDIHDLLITRCSHVDGAKPPPAPRGPGDMMAPIMIGIDLIVFPVGLALGLVAIALYVSTILATMG